MPVPVFDAESVHLNRSLVPVVAPKVNEVVFAAIVSARFVVGFVKDDQTEDPPPEPQAEPVPDTTPDVFTWRHWLEPVMAPSVRLVEAESVVNAPVDGVVPPIGPGEGNADVDPPRGTELPAIVIAELARPAFVRVPDSPSWTLPADGLAKVIVSPLVAALFSKFTVALELRPVPLT